MTLTELRVYRLKVDLFVHHYGQHSGLFGDGGRALAGSSVWLDQITPDGWAIFGLFAADHDGFAPGLYVKCPVDIADEQIEEDLDEAGQPCALQQKTPTLSMTPDSPTLLPAAAPQAGTPLAAFSVTRPALFVLDEATDTFTQLPSFTDTSELRALVGFRDMEDGDERVIRFRRVDVVDAA